jgi:hypothetical protein
MADIYNDLGSPDTPGATSPEPEATYTEVEIPAGKTYEGSRHAAAGGLPEWQQLIMDWTRENQVLAMVGGFALGVFLGVLIRD